MADPALKETDAGTAQVPPVVVKKYANRRLYNTEKFQLHHAGKISPTWCGRAATSWSMTPRPATTSPAAC